MISVVVAGLAWGALVPTMEDRARAATDPVVVPAAVPAEWPAAAERLALDYSVTMAWPNRCPTFTWDVVANADAVVGRDVEGYAVLDRCHFSLDVSATENSGIFCDVFVHERLHLVRQDVWHDPTPNSPLYREANGYAPCHPEWLTIDTPPHPAVDWLERWEVRSLIARRLGPRWRVNVLEYSINGDNMDAIVRAGLSRRRARGGRALVRRLYYIRQDESGAVQIELYATNVRTRTALPRR